jgi:hypothetical protein
MITVPSTPPHIPHSKMKISPSPHSVQFSHLCSDLMNDENIPKPNINQPTMSVDTALKKKLSKSKANEFRLPIPLDVSPKPTHQRRSSTGGQNATWTPLNSPKHEFVYNKVIQKKYNTAATTIQRVMRGFFGRYKVARILSTIQIQTMVRERRQRLVIQKQAACVVIQASVRGWRCRIRKNVFQLEHELRQIERRKEREMLDIQAWKRQEMETIRLSAQSTSEEYSQQFFKNKETLEKAETLIKHLRKDNKKLRDKNDALQVAITLLMEENKIFEKQALEFKIYSEQMNEMAMINHENEALTDLLAQFENRKAEFEQALVCRDERIMFENKVGRLYLNCIKGIVLSIEDACDDEELVFLVEELCVHCNIPGSGSGLDETEKEVSEHMLY